MTQPSIEVDDFIYDQPRSIANAVILAFLEARTQDAYSQGKKAGWPNSVLQDIDAQISQARQNDQPWDKDADPEEFLEYARGSDDFAKEGYAALQTWDLFTHNHTVSLSQSQYLANYLVDLFQGQFLTPVSLAPQDLMAHAQNNPDAQYLVRWRSTSWVAHASSMVMRKSEMIYGPLPGSCKPISELSQVWILEPVTQA